MHKKLKLLLIFLAAAITAHAQKLPNKQEKSVWAPANIKIDGRANEWDGKFEAFNHATEIWYTMANDNDNLYLTVQATEPDVINKIIGKGLTLSIEAPGKKNDKDRASITYPLTDKNTGGMLIYFAGKKGVVADTSLKDLQTIMYNHNQMLTKGKWIGITGIKGFDSLLSVYNEDGIRAAGQLNIRAVYTLEISVKLSYLRQFIQDTRLMYQIQLNGGILRTTNVPMPPDLTPAQAAMWEKNSMQVSQHAVALNSPTDFWGEYTLAKKP